MLQYSLDLDIAVLKDYDESLHTFYSLNSNPEEPYISTQFCHLDITFMEEKPFWLAFEKLMDSFKIPDQHRENLFFLLQNFYAKIDEINLLNDDLKSAVKALNFFIKYQQEVAFAQAKGRFKTTTEAVNSKLKVLIKSQYNGEPIALDYFGSTSLVVNALYQGIKSDNVTLIDKLGGFKKIPSAKTLTVIKDQLDFDIDNPYYYQLIETIESLQKYFKTYIPKELSRKQSYLIFELLYLFNFLQYAGKVSNYNSSEFTLKTGRTKIRNFSPLLNLSDNEKGSFILSLVKKQKRNARYHSTSV